MRASLTEIFVTRKKGKYTLGCSSSLMKQSHKTCEDNDMLINQVKAHFTLTTELVSITKESQMLLVVGNILLQDLNSTALEPRLVIINIIFPSVSYFSFQFLERHSLEML